jgi:predicted transposase YdaD
LINEILTHEEGIAMAGAELLTISRDEVERARLESEFRYELDRQCELEDARQAGLADGRQAGLADGRQAGLKDGEVIGLEKAARRLRALGLPPDQIAQVTGLDPEETVYEPAAAEIT